MKLSKPTEISMCSWFQLATGVVCVFGGPCVAGAIGDRSVTGTLLGANMVFAGILLLVWLGIGKNTLAIYGAICGYVTGVIVFALLAWRSSDFYHYFAGERESDFWVMFVLYAWLGTYFGTLLGFLCPKKEWLRARMRHSHNPSPEKSNGQ